MRKTTTKKTTTKITVKTAIKHLDKSVKSAKDVIEVLDYVSDTLLDKWLQGDSRAALNRRDDIIDMADDLKSEVESYFESFDDKCSND